MTGSATGRCKRWSFDYGFEDRSRRSNRRCLDHCGRFGNGLGGRSFNDGWSFDNRLGDGSRFGNGLGGRSFNDGWSFDNRLGVSFDERPARRCGAVSATGSAGAVSMTAEFRQPARA